MPERTNFALIGGFFAGIAASLCCVGPLVLLLLGFTGAWVGSLTALEPYRPVFIAVALTALAIAYVSIFRIKPEQSCREGMVCAEGRSIRLYKRLFLTVALVVLASIASPYLIPLLYG
ncbi:MAG: mercuric transporter MerT family protein [Gammaproteobacteria bacterium]